MTSRRIQKISRFGFGVLIAGSLLSGVVLVYLLFSLDRMKQGQQITEEAYDALIEVKYYTERLLTTEDLEKEQHLWLDAGTRFGDRLARMEGVRGAPSESFTRLWTVVRSEMADVSNQLRNPLFQAGYTMERPLLRRLGEGINANERSDYYIALNHLFNSIEYLKQYEGFLVEEFTALRDQHKAEVTERLAHTRTLAIVLPGAILLLTFVFAAYSSREIGKIERRLMDTQTDLEQTLDQVREQREALRFMAHHDALTHLPNRVLLLERMEQMCRRAAASGTAAAVLFIDLDRFKEVNDSLGHSRGDDLLITVSKRLRANIRPEDTLARLGGDEFVVLLDAITSPAAAGAIAQQLIAAMQAPIAVDETTLYITTSIGISVHPTDGTEAGTLLRNADSAMYRAKKDGRNTYRFYSADMTAAAMERLALDANMRRALEQNEFVLHYQPQYELASNRLIGLEALIRWQHPDHGLVSPARFIPFAEETGLIVPIGSWVLRAACEQAVLWHQSGMEPGRMAVNLSERQLHQADFFDVLRDVLAATGCRPEWLELEITEGFLITDPERSIRVLKGIGELGVQISIDDFGTGYSSLAYLKRLPIDRLKLDQSFVRGIPADAEDTAIVRAIIALGKEMGLTVIAEGVETPEQRAFLRKEGCAEAQGYLLGRPMPAEEATALLNARRQGTFRSA
jgi:diguanylate cyclase (GGDEF)-like protein